MTQPPQPAYPGPPPGYYPWPGPPPPPMSPAGVPLADFASRLLAYMIDMALLSVVVLVLAIPGFVLVFRQFPAPETYGPDTDFDAIFDDFFLPLLLLELGIVVVLMLAYFLYSVEYMHRSGQTVGKKAMKIRIVPIDPTKKLTRGMAAKRYLVEYIGGTFLPFFSYVDGLWQLWDKPYQQTLHDKFARTVVVKVSP